LQNFSPKKIPHKGVQYFLRYLCCVVTLPCEAQNFIDRSLLPEVVLNY